jgi:uncharacterized surface protein with fasciclin (FAS1) repeats
MKKSLIITAIVLAITLISNNLFAQTPPKDTVKQQRDTTKKATTTTTTTTPDTTSKKDIVATLANVAEETEFSAAIKAANLETELKGPGLYTVLAPNNADFDALQKGKLDSLMKDPTKLPVTVKAHIISGLYDKAALVKALTAGKGTATLKTIGGQTLTISVKNKKLTITDPQGTVVEVTSFDTPATNGVIHGINGVLMSK